MSKCVTESRSPRGGCLVNGAKTGFPWGQNTTRHIFTLASKCSRLFVNVHEPSLRHTARGGSDFLLSIACAIVGRRSGAVKVGRGCRGLGGDKANPVGAEAVRQGQLGVPAGRNIDFRECGPQSVAGESLLPAVAS